MRAATCRRCEKSPCDPLGRCSLRVASVGCPPLRTSAQCYRALGEATAGSLPFISNVRVARLWQYTAPPPCRWPDRLQQNMRDGPPRRLSYFCMPQNSSCPRRPQDECPPSDETPPRARDSPKFGKSGGPRGDLGRGQVATFPVAPIIFLYIGEFTPPADIRFPA